MFQDLIRTGGPGGELAALGRDAAMRLMLRAGDHDTLVTIDHGVVTSVTEGPFVMPSWDIRLSAPAEEWRKFLQPVPPPGAHDLMALTRRGVMVMEGDLRPLMTHLLYVKLLLASLRPAPVPAPAAAPAVGETA